MLPLGVCNLGILSLALMFPLALAGCTKNGTPSPKTSDKPKKDARSPQSSPHPGPPPQGGREKAPGGWGSITGQLVYDGDVPAPVPLNLGDHKDAPACRAAATTANVELVKEDWVVSKENKGIRWAVVFLTPDPPAKGARLPVHPDLEKVPDQNVVIDQPCCRFEPHVLAFRQGQTLTVKNSANMAHALKWSAIGQAGDSVTIPANSSGDLKGIKA